MMDLLLFFPRAKQNCGPVVGVPDVSVVGVDVEVGGEGLGSSSPRFMPLRGVQSLVLFSSGYGTGENRQLGFGEISIFFLSHIIINNRVGCGGGISSLYFMFVSGFLLPPGPKRTRA